MLQILVNKWFKADTEAHKDSDSLPQEFMPVSMFTWTIPVAGRFSGAVCSSLSVSSHCLDMHFTDETVRMKSEIAVVNPFIQRKICAFALKNKSTFLKLAVHLVFQHAHGVLAVFKHSTNLNYEPLGQRFVSAFWYIKKMSNTVQHATVQKSQTGWRVWGSGWRRRKPYGEICMYLSKIDAWSYSNKLNFK